MKRFRLFALGPLALALGVAETVAPPQKAQTLPAPTRAPVPVVGAADVTLLDRPRTNGHPILAPGPDDWKIARLVATVLQQSHYSQQPFDDAMSARFLDRYLDALDPAHLIFLQSDEEEFGRWRASLDDLTLRAGDTSPAHIIFNRYLDRFEEQVRFATNFVATECFEFTGTNRYLLHRRDQPRPRDAAEARQLWAERIRYEYLIEKLNLPHPPEIGQRLLETLESRKPQDILDSIRESRAKKQALLEKQKQEAESPVASTNDVPPAPTEVRVWNHLTTALKGKVSEARADQIVEFIEPRLGKEKAADIVQALTARLEKDNAEEIVKIITRRYSRQWRMLREFDSDEVLQIYLTALAHAYDPHSDYMSRSSLENFNISMRLSLYGIGALLRSEDGYVKIQELMPGGPALLSRKIKPNDKIVAVAQGTNEPVDVVDMKLSKVVELIRGPKDTEVRLTIIPADAPDGSTRKVVSLIRKKIELEDQEAKARIIEWPRDKEPPLRLGVIDLPSFYADMESRRAGRKSTTTDVRRLLTKLKQENVKGLILDLRRNGGGSLEEAINLTGLFIKQGPVVQVRDPDRKVTVDADTDPEVAYDGPLVVLTSRFSASASEILAAALQDYGRAVVVGDISTHGKGTVQSLLQLAPLVRPPPTNGLGALKYTIRKFYRVTGSSTQLKGVTPDIVLPSINNYADVGEAALTNALPWDTIDKADFEAVDVVPPLLPELRRRSAARVEADKDFAFLRGEIERYRKTRDEKTVSLNEAERRKEKKENEARAEARKKELKARGEPPGKTYEITLKLVDQPGLPPPLSKTNALAARDGRLRAKAEDELLDDEENDPTPAFDVTLEETKRILADLIELTEKSKALAGPAQ